MTNEEKLQDRLNKAIEVFRQKEAEIAELKSFIESKDKALKILQDTYNEVFAENTKLKEEIEQIKNNNAKLTVEIKELRSQVNWLDEDNEYLQSRNEALENKLEEPLNIKEVQEKTNIFTPVKGAFTI